MDSYHDAAWFDGMVRQYEIAFDAYSDTLDRAVEDLAPRIGEENLAAIQDALLCCDIPEQVPLPALWIQRRALLQKIRAVMGPDFALLKARLDLLSTVSDRVAAEVAQQKGWSTDDAADSMFSYREDQSAGFCGGFLEWVARNDEEARQVNVAANQYLELQQKKPEEAARCLEAVRAYFSGLKIDVAALLAAYARDERTTTGLVDWALNGGLNVAGVALPAA